jgi:hypothetical protein
MGAKDPHVRLQSARDVVIALQAWLPVAKWQALALAVEKPESPAVAQTALAPALSSSANGNGYPKSTTAPAGKGGFFAFLRRLFGR